MARHRSRCRRKEPSPSSVGEGQPFERKRKCCERALAGGEKKGVGRMHGIGREKEERDTSGRGLGVVAAVGRLPATGAAPRERRRRTGVRVDPPGKTDTPFGRMGV